jgi:hypothetical protein
MRGNLVWTIFSEGIMRSPYSILWVAAILATYNSRISTAAAQTIGDGYSFTTLNDPAAIDGTTPFAVSGNTVVGGYGAKFANYGFLYDGSSFGTLEVPGEGGNSPATVAFGISGNTIVGYYTDANSAGHGFVYNGSTYTTLDEPSGSNTSARGVSGSTIVGTYQDTSFTTHGFIYSGGVYRSTDDPSAIDTGASSGTFVRGTSGNNIVGYFTGSNGTEGFIYNGTTWTTLTDPLATDGTFVTGISGNTVVGYYGIGDNSYDGFIYNGSAFTTVNDPLAAGTPSDLQQVITIINGISENGTIVGTFAGVGASGGFIATPVVPEPASAALLSAGALLLLRRGRHPRRRP